MHINRFQKYSSFFSLCVFFTIISACSPQNKPLIPFQKRIDTQKNQYQFLQKSFIPQDIQSLKDNNLDLKTAENRIIQSQALYRQAFSGYLPQVTAGFSANKQISNQAGGQNAFVMQPPGNLTFYSVNSEVSFMPDFFGRTKLRTMLADNQIQANHLEAQTSYLNVLNGYVKNYNLVCATKELLDIHKNTVTLNQNIEKSVGIRYKLGRTNSIDYYNAQDNLLSARIRHDKAIQNHNIALQSYYSLIGKSVADKDKTPVCNNGFIPLPQENIVINIQDLDNRPDIQAIQYRLKSAYHTLDLSLKAIYPDISVLFSVQSFSDSLSNILDVNRFINNLIGQVSQTIYDGGMRDAQIDISKADLELVKQTYHNTVLTAGNNLITLGKNLKLAMTLEQQAKNRLATATNALDSATRSYKMGNIQFINLLTSQSNYYNAQLEFVALKHNMRDLYSDVLTATGIAPIQVD